MWYSCPYLFSYSYPVVWYSSPYLFSYSYPVIQSPLMFLCVLVRGSPCLCTVWSYAFFLSVSFGCSLLSGRTLYLVRLRDSSLIFCRSLPSRLFLRKVLFRAFPGLGCVGFSVPFQLAETSGGRLVPLCPRQHFCILEILCFTNGEKTVTPMNPLHNGWSYTGHVTWSFACRYIFVFEQCCTVHLSACLSLIRAGAVTVRGGGQQSCHADPWHVCA